MGEVVWCVDVSVCGDVGLLNQDYVGIVAGDAVDKVEVSPG